VGISLLKINIFQRFKYQKNSTVLLVFETLKNIFTRGFLLLKVSKNRVLWKYPKKILNAYGNIPRKY